jgi:hypothetical protein
MRKYFSALSIGMAFLILAILSGCDKDFEEIIDVSTTSYQVTGTSSFSSFRYVVGDSVITIYLNLNSSSNISSVFCDIIASDGKKLNNNPVFLLDNGNAANGDQTAGDNRFTNRFPLSQQNPIGAYRINFYVTNRAGTTKLAAVQQFTYDNGQTNVAPVIFNAIVDPDSIVVTDTILIQTSVQVDDSNGLNDVEFVYFSVFNPGSTGGAQVSLFDDGNTQQNGDLIAGDGIFSRIISVNQNNEKGTYRFQFQARDRGGLLSNTIDYFVLIQ